ncbi:MAG: sulfotransferase family protein [Candidatus Latescibacteria bacterium]|nr:sulfotransferase family protein [Candidatus Latescibacterota bacterium]
MMMQMLHAGGLPLLIDQIRPANPANPAGYFEFEPVKRLREDASWLGQARGKGVKIISPLLYALPDQFDYQILFMQRSLDQIMASQRAMIEEQSRAVNIHEDNELRGHFEQHLEAVESWLQEQSNMAVLPVTYLDVIDNPLEAARQIASFLCIEVSLQHMAQAVRPDLLRQRN